MMLGLRTEHYILEAAVTGLAGLRAAGFGFRDPQKGGRGRALL